ncbi:MAG: HAMP domain-containing sensor histidine kinase [Candidatus Omnitrophica bacterium]|nr:HAMP domain-containing sensor histidine kinase [Candidatus Omnitrophota bacterium]
MPASGDAEKKTKPKSGKKLNFPVIIFLVGILLTAALWDFSNEQKVPLVEERVGQTASQLSTHLSRFLAERFIILKQLGHLWRMDSPVTKSDFSTYVGNMMSITFGFEAVFFLDSSGKIQWEKTDPEISHVDLKLLERECAGEVFTSARAEAGKAFHTAVTRPFGKNREHKFFAFIVPVGKTAVPEGYVVGFFSIKRLFDFYFERTGIQDFNYLIADHRGVFYSNLVYVKEATAPRPFKTVRPISVENMIWSLNMWPKETFLVSHAYFKLSGFLILFMGFLFSVSAALLAWSIVSRNKFLEYEVARRTRQLEIRNKELGEKNEEIEGFVYSISHDLKAPIVSIEGFVSMLNSEYKGQSNEETQRFIERIGANANQMHGLIKDLLEFSRIGRLDEAREDVDSSLIVKDLIEREYATQLKAKNIKVEAEGDFPVLYGSQNRIHQIFSNLIGNAIKYIGVPDRPLIKVGCMDKASPLDYPAAVADAEEKAKKLGKMYVFYVKDNGIGIPEEYKEKIFMLFQRVPGGEETEGTGMGLSIVRKIIETYGGEIWAESELGKGSSFYFTFPRPQAV